MPVAGIDIGSRTIGIVLLDPESLKIVGYQVFDSGYNPVERAEQISKNYAYDYIVATGYGRHAALARFANEVITEITAYAVGARYYSRDVRSILDIGGQDTKAILLSESGSVIDFQMNEKCSAGTGKFLEIMADALGYSLDEFGEAASKAEGMPLRISSMCTVFAESEVVSLLHSGESREMIAKAVQLSIVERTVAMLKRIGAVPPVFFAGGVAKNTFIRNALEKKLSASIIVPDEPQIVGALGCALTAARKLSGVDLVS
jgi:predicted CoA-substrate-specific enzyme activase